MPKNVFAEPVIEVEHYADGLFRFCTHRPCGLRFRSGEYVMIGLPGAPMRAYSIASPNWDDTLEFYSRRVPGGPLTERLKSVRPGDMLLIGRRTSGTLINHALLPGKRLFLFGTGTGAAPFASIIRDPETYEKFDEVIVTETCRTVAELRFAKEMVDAAFDDPLLGEFIEGRLTLFTSATRQPYPRRGRITDLLRSGAFFRTLGIPPLDPVHDRAMICGSMPMLRDTRAILEEAGLREASCKRPASYVVERAFTG